MVAEAPAPRLQVQTLGTFAVWRDGTRLPDTVWRRRHAGALLKFLLSAPNRRLTRSAIIDTLWPTTEAVVTPQQGRAALRASLYHLRRLLDGPAPIPGRVSVVVASGASVALIVCPDGHPDTPLAPETWLDAVAFRRATERALDTWDAPSCRATLALYTGPYLPDDRALDAEWPERLVAQRRERLHSLSLRLLLHLADIDAAAGAVRATEDSLRAVLRAEPFHEGAALRLMRLLNSAGQRGAALRVYDDLAAALQATFSVAPSANIAVLRARLVAEVETEGEGRPLLALPHLPSRFVGRVREQAAVRAEMAEARAVTLVGPGGCGKTRLALAVADAVASAHPDGVWYVDLAEVTEPVGITRALIEGLSLASEPGQPPLATLLAALRTRHLLLVLDTCERVAVPCAALLSHLLVHCPGLHLLAVSRVVLDLAGGVVYRVPPLTWPASGTERTPDALLAYDAVALFVDRARRRSQQFVLTPENAAAIGRLCARLDGLALGIELAAAQVGTLPVPQIAARIDADLASVSTDPTRATPRHRSLHATLDWSLALLDEAAQTLLQRLAVFAGGWTADAAVVVGRGGPVDGARIPDLLARLVDASLVVLDDQSVPARYHLLDLVREAAWERCQASGEEVAVVARHRDWCVALAGAAAAQLSGPAQGAWLASLRVEYDNLRRVLDEATRVGGRASLPTPDGSGRETERTAWATAALRIVAALGRFWEGGAPLDEGQRRLTEALANADPADASYGPALAVAGRLALLLSDESRASTLFTAAQRWAEARSAHGTAARALLGLSELALGAGERERAAQWCTEAQTHADAAGDTEARAEAAEMQGRVAHNRSRIDGIARASARLDEADAWYEESLDLRRAAGDTRGVAQALVRLGDVALDREAYARAARHYREAGEHAARLGDRMGRATALFSEGVVAEARGAFPEARLLFEQAVATARTIGARGRTALWLLYLSDMRSRAGDLAGARACLDESRDLYRALGDTEGLANMRSTEAEMALLEGDSARAAALADACIRELRTQGNTSDIVFALYYLACTTRLQGDLERAGSLHQEGLRLVQGQFGGWFRRNGVCTHLWGLGQTRALQGQHRQAVQLLGAAVAVAAPAQRPLAAWERPAYDQIVAALRGTLGEAAFDQLWARGYALAMEEAITSALDAPEASG